MLPLKRKPGSTKVDLAALGWMMKKTVMIAAFAALLAGCTQSIDEMSYSQLQAYAGQMVEKCQKQGVPTNQLQTCAEQEMRADQARRMKQRQFGAALAGASQAYGQNMQRNAAINRSVTCTSTPNSTWVGGPVSSVRTTCY